MMHIRQCAPERHRLHPFMQISWRLMAIMRSSGFHIQCPSVISMGLRQAFDNIKNDPDMLERHRKIGEAVRAAVVEAGLELY